MLDLCFIQSNAFMRYCSTNSGTDLINVVFVIKAENAMLEKKLSIYALLNFVSES